MNHEEEPLGPLLFAGEVADDEALDAAFDRLLRALQGGDLEGVADCWRLFESNLVAHMDYEEQRVTPRIAAISLREALAILQEHRFLRGRLREIGEAIGRGTVRFDDARSFRDELRAHARHEDAIFKRVIEAGAGPWTP